MWHISVQANYKHMLCVTVQYLIASTSSHPFFNVPYFHIELNFICNWFSSQQLSVIIIHRAPPILLISPIIASGRIEYT